MVLKNLYGIGIEHIDLQLVGSAESPLLSSTEIIVFQISF